MQAGANITVTMDQWSDHRLIRLPGMVGLRGSFLRVPTPVLGEFLRRERVNGGGRQNNLSDGNM